jgi:hypothetical protein
MTNTKLQDGAGASVAARQMLDASILLGEWSNTNTAATGIARLVLSQTANGIVVRVFGAGHPEPFDWGEAPAEIFADSPESMRGNGFTSFHDMGFMSVWLLAFVNKGVLVLVSMTCFHDDSGRSNYWGRELLFRSKKPVAAHAKS